MTDNQSERRGPFAGCLAVGLLLALPAYLLSIGPFIWLANRGYLPMQLGVIYAPLGLIQDRPPFGRLIAWYMSLWQ
jgi:hypothetical protein